MHVYYTHPPHPRNFYPLAVSTVSTVSTVPTFSTFSIISTVSTVSTVSAVSIVSPGMAGGPAVFFDPADPAGLHTTPMVGAPVRGHYKIASTASAAFDGSPAAWVPGTAGTVASIPKGFEQSWMVYAPRPLAAAAFPVSRVFPASSATAAAAGIGSHAATATTAATAVAGADATAAAGAADAAAATAAAPGGGRGITAVVHRWGQFMQRLHNTTRITDDITTTKLQYQTDNGAQYVEERREEMRREEKRRKVTRSTLLLSCAVCGGVRCVVCGVRGGCIHS